MEEFDPSVVVELGFCSLSVAYSLVPRTADLTGSKDGARIPKTAALSVSCLGLV